MTKNGKLSKLQEVFLKRANELHEAMSDPEATMTRLQDSIVNIQAEDPRLAGHIAAGAMNRLGMIYKRLPKGPPMGSLGGGYDDYIPSDHAIAKFSRYAAAAWNPTSVLDRMAQGNLTKEEADALRDTSPEIYSRIQTRVMEGLQKKKGKLPFKKSVQLSILFGLPADTSFRPEAIKARQEVFMEEQAPPDGNIRNTVDSEETNVQRLQK